MYFDIVSNPMGSNSASMTMVCNCDVPQRKVFDCFNDKCHQIWIDEKQPFERERCPVHTVSDDTTCDTPMPKLCCKCRNNGFFLERNDDNSDRYSKFIIKRRYPIKFNIDSPKCFRIISQY